MCVYRKKHTVDSTVACLVGEEERNLMGSSETHDELTPKIVTIILHARGFDG